MRLLGKALTFDDVLLVPAYSQVLPTDTSLATQFSRNIALNLPLVSAAMDTVTEARLAIAIAQEGGMSQALNMIYPYPERFKRAA
jgi:IMP dehydrogenase